MALGSGYPHPDFVTDLLSPRQAEEARQYFMQEPFGDRETQRLLATLIAMVYNYIRPKGSRPVKHTDFLAGRIPVVKMQQEKIQSAFRNWVAANNEVH